MQAKERRGRHFKSSVGLMLNENYGDGLIPNTVQNQDFLYMPATDYPVSGTGWAFLESKLGQQPHVHKPRSIGTSDSLYQAYRRAFGQPVGMVHYDRDPFYWQSKARPGSEIGSFKSCSLSSSRLRNYDLIFNGYERDPGVPEEHPTSTVKSALTSKSDRSNITRSTSDVRKTAGSGSVNSKTESASYKGKLEDNRHRLWTPDEEAGGFKPYSPFSDSLQDFGKKEAKYISPEIKPEVDRTCDVLPAPLYRNALNKMLEGTDDGKSSVGNGMKNKAEVLKLHGNPEYPDKVMDDKDVPNYVAWAKIYPYCPLTQIEGQEKPVFVPPRGFTPTTLSRTGSVAKLRDVKKEKRKILEGIKLLSASSSARKAGKGRQQVAEGKTRKDVEIIHAGLQALPPSLAAKLNPVLKGEEVKGINGNKNGNSSADNWDINNNSSGSHFDQNKGDRSNKKPTFSSSAVPPPVNYDPHATRKLLDMKLKAPTGWYGGQTPTHTPTPEPSLPIKANRTWAKHYSPQRIRQFMRAINGDPSTPCNQEF